MVFNTHRSVIISSKHSYVTFNKAEFLRLNLNVELKYAHPGDSIRFDMDNNQSLYKNDIRFPICKRLFRRYIGEDVTIECKWDIKFVNILNYETKWTHNGKEIAHSIRKKITSISGEYIFETLRILLISGGDYGKYQLWVSGHPTENHIKEYRKINYMIAYMFLTPIHHMISYVYVPVGNGLILDYQVDYSFETKIVGWEYKIENSLTGTKALHEKYDRLFDGCSLFSYILMQTLMTILGGKYHINKPNTSRMTNNVINVNAILCTTEVLYGKHSINILREFYNETEKSKQIVTTALNFVYIVLPAESFNMYNINYEKYNTTLKVEDIERSDLIHESRIWFIRQIIEIVSVIVSAFYILKFCKYYTYLFDTHWVSTIYTTWFNRGKVEHLSNNGLGNIFNENEWHNYEFDVLVISTENDNDFIMKNSIITCLEDIGYKVCFPERDFKAGKSMFRLFSKAVQISYTIVVVCSKDFMHDSFINEIVFGDFIMSMYKDGKINNKNILLVIKDDCNIPNVLMRKFEILDTIETFPTTRSIKRQLCIWIKSRIPPIKNMTMFAISCVICLYLNILSVVLLTMIIILRIIETYSELTLLSSRFMSDTYLILLITIFCTQLAVMKYGRRMKI
ncbi:Hypothetical predicted protein [Mytilus galloprovincialis]|uniref:TIR domain-containing protein n=1 Tax=Mytilus galloprovincialis TaxID=29158 RepID=A0A8B6EBT0_MYTGA|nr:Hypothetical predicted protein [Mytilus galloprovincialis]